MSYQIIPRDAKHHIRIEATEYQDKKYLDLRLNFLKEETDEWIPMKKGITVPLEILPEMVVALTKIGESCQLNGSVAEKIQME